MASFWGRRLPTVNDQEHAGCSKHPLDPSVSICARCQRSCCKTCALQVRDQHLCIDCGVEMAGVRVRRRRRR